MGRIVVSLTGSPGGEKVERMKKKEEKGLKRLTGMKPRQGSDERVGEKVNYLVWTGLDRGSGRPKGGVPRQAFPCTTVQGSLLWSTRSRSALSCKAGTHLYPHSAIVWMSEWPFNPSMKEPQRVNTRNRANGQLGRAKRGMCN